MKMISEKLRFMHRALIAFAIAFPTIYVGVQFAATLRDYRTTISNAEADTRTMSSALKEHATRSIGEADRLLRLAIADVEQSRLAPTWGNSRKLERILAQFENFCVVTESVRHGIDVSVSVTDADGVQLHGTARAKPGES